ncbi:MAG: bestrophin-like domain [Reyranella sp.]
MAHLVNGLAEDLHDLVILAIAAAVFGAAGAVISFVAHHAWFRFWPVRSGADNQLSDTVQTSLLAFSAFILALSVTNVFGNLAKAEESAMQEALDLTRLDRELGALGNAAKTARQTLADYTRHVSTDEWRTLSKELPKLSPLAQHDMDALWTEIRAIQRNEAVAPAQIRDALNSYLMRLEQFRAERLAAATNSIPSIFWFVIILFVAAASFMNGRNTLRRFGVHLIVIHMSAIGILVALIVIVDNPYRGATSVSSSIIADAVRPPSP